MRHFQNLDEVVAFLKKATPEFTIGRGNNTWINEEDIRHTENYEVVQVFDPKDEWGRPFAEFWEGYDETNPSDYVGFHSPTNRGKRRYFICKGDLDWSVEAILKKSRMR